MSTLAIGRKSAIGHASIFRGYAITWPFQSMLSRLIEFYRGAVTFASFNESIAQLEAEVTAALAGNELSDEAKNKVIAAILPATEFLVARPIDVPRPEVDVWQDGRIAFEWYERPGRVVDATIDANRRLVFSALVGQERRGAVDFIDGEWPVELIEAIRDNRP